MNWDFSYTRTKETIKNLPNGKSPGPDGLAYEFFKYGGEPIFEYLSTIFENINRQEKVPTKWNEGNGALIHKGNGKQRTNIANYRPITMTNCVSKIYANILNEELNEWAEKNDILSEEQNGFRKNRCCTDNIYIIQQAINIQKTRRKPLYLAVLDLEKAYDNISRDFLYHMLDTMGCDKKAINIIKSLYMETKVRFKVNNTYTRWINSNQGLRQGCNMSPFLFAIVMEELIARIKELDIGIKIDGLRLCILLYADDIILIAESEEDLRKALICTRNFGSVCNLAISQNKSKIIVAGKQPNSMPGAIEGLKVVDSVRYLGLTLDRNGFQNNVEKKIIMGKQWIGRMGAEARFQTHSNQIIRDSWKVMAVPQIMYGAETIQFTKKHISDLETIQNKIGKIALNAGSLLTNVANRGEMCWSTFNSRIARTKLKFKAKIDLADQNSWISIVHRAKCAKNELAESCYKFLTSYDIRWRLDDCNLIINDTKMADRNNIKNRIDNIIMKKELERWKKEMDGKTSLTIYREKKAPLWCNIYSRRPGTRTLMEFRTDSFISKQRVNWLYTSVTCDLCPLRKEENTEHIILHCQAYETDRKAYYKVMATTLGEELYNIINSSEMELLRFILGFCSLTREWWLLWEHTLKFLNAIAVIRYRRNRQRGKLKELINQLGSKETTLRRRMLHNSDRSREAYDTARNEDNQNVEIIKERYKEHGAISPSTSRETSTVKGTTGDLTTICGFSKEAENNPVPSTGIKLPDISLKDLDKNEEPSVIKIKSRYYGNEHKINSMRLHTSGNSEHNLKDYMEGYSGRERIRLIINKRGGDLVILTPSTSDGKSAVGETCIRKSRKERNDRMTPIEIKVITGNGTIKANDLQER